MNKRTIIDATLHNSYTNSTSPGFMVEFSISLVNFDLECLNVWNLKTTKYVDAEIACFGSPLELLGYKLFCISL